MHILRTSEGDFSYLWQIAVECSWLYFIPVCMMSHARRIYEYNNTWYIYTAMFNLQHSQNQP